jgi:gluconolactonase
VIDPVPVLRPAPGPDRHEVLVDGLDHPEGVAYDPVSGAVYAGGEAGQVYRVDLARRRVEQVASAPGFVLGLAVDGRGRVAVCASSDGSLCALADGTVCRVLDEVEGEPLVLPNHPSFGPDGTLYLSDSGTWGRNDGRLVRLSPDGDAQVLSQALNRFPNGGAVSPDGRHLWMVESFAPTLSRLDLSSDGRPEVVLRLDGHVPDGIAFTADGGLLISCYRPDRILHLDAAGRVDVVAEDPQGTLLSAPTNICFAGPDMDRVVSANLGRWHLTLLDLGLAGAPLHHPDRWALDAVVAAHDLPGPR